MKLKNETPLKINVYFQYFFVAPLHRACSYNRTSPHKDTFLPFFVLTLYQQHVYFIILPQRPTCPGRPSEPAPWEPAPWEPAPRGASPGPLWVIFLSSCWIFTNLIESKIWNFDSLENRQIQSPARSYSWRQSIRNKKKEECAAKCEWKSEPGSSRVAVMCVGHYTHIQFNGMLYIHMIAT